MALRVKKSKISTFFSSARETRQSWLAKWREMWAHEMGQRRRNPQINKNCCSFRQKRFQCKHKKRRTKIPQKSARNDSNSVSFHLQPLPLASPPIGNAKPFFVRLRHFSAFVAAHALAAHRRRSVTVHKFSRCISAVFSVPSGYHDHERHRICRWITLFALVPACRLEAVEETRNVIISIFFHENVDGDGFFVMI